MVGERGVSAEEGSQGPQPELEVSTPSQGSSRGQPLLPHEACAPVVPVWLLQEAQGERGLREGQGLSQGVCEPTLSGTISSMAWKKASYSHHGPRSSEVESNPMLVPMNVTLAQCLRKQPWAG